MSSHRIPLVATTVAALVALAAPAMAGGAFDPVGGEVSAGKVAGLKYVTESLAVGSSGTMDPPYEEAAVSCGPHSSPWHPTAGGAKMSGGAAANTIKALRPLDLDDAFETPPNSTPDDWWDVTVKSVVGRTLTGYAVCSTSTFSYVRLSVPADTSTDRTATVSCPAGKHLVGGGGFIATSDSRITSSFPVDGDTWKVALFDSVGGLGGMEAYAVCRKAGRVARVSHRVGGIGADTADTATVMCAPTRHVIGGGGRMGGPIAQGSLAASLPVDGSDGDQIPDDGWRVVGYNHGGAAKALTAYALCVKKG